MVTYALSRFRPGHSLVPGHLYGLGTRLDLAWLHLTQLPQETVWQTKLNFFTSKTAAQDAHRRFTQHFPYSSQHFRAGESRKPLNIATWFARLFFLMRGWVLRTRCGVTQPTFRYIWNSFFPKGSRSDGVAARWKKTFGFTNKKKSLNKNPTRSLAPRTCIMEK